MKLIFEEETPGRHCHLLPSCGVPIHEIGIGKERKLNLLELSENKTSRHYTGLVGRAHGVNGGFYLLGSYTMKYNPKVNEEVVSLEGFADIHPLQPEHTVQDALRVFGLAKEYLREITGMETMAFRPAASAHGESAGLLLIKAYYHFKGDEKRMRITVPDSARGTNPVSAAMAGYNVVSIPSGEDGHVDLDKLKEAAGEDATGLMLVNLNTVGLFDENILEITRIVHEAGRLCYYDGANLNAIIGIVRPGDIGFNVIHLNLHETFSTSRGEGGPGSGPVGCRKFLRPFLPGSMVKAPGEGEGRGVLSFVKKPKFIRRVKMFYGNFGVVVKALSYIMALGREGIPEASSNAVLNANYTMNKLSDLYKTAYNETCMHEFVMTLEDLEHDTNVSTMDTVKAFLDYDIHPPTMYLPLIVHETLTVEPTETEPRKMLDQAIEIFRSVYEAAKADPESFHQAPVKTTVRRLGEVIAARGSVLRYMGE